ELPGRDDGCYFADLSAISDGSEVPAAVAEALRLEPNTGGGTSASRQLVEYLAGRDALLVLDNCERVVAAPPLNANDDTSPAVELFIERALAVNPTMRASRAERSTIGEICRRLDGMPLAIELAAARAAVLTPGEILNRMADRFGLLSGGRGRHRLRTLQATLDWSYDLLDEEEQTLFRSLGLFVGSFDLAAAQALATTSEYDTMDLMESLVAKNLVTIDQSSFGTTRYRLLESVRIYASDQLVRLDEAGRTQDAYAEYYCDLTTTSDFVVAGGI
ncbi:MAG: ATP-binding protein, partial [Acidimicrobiales bacterium]